MEEAPYFTMPLTAIQKHGKWGYIDKTGREVVAPAYDEARDFSIGLAAVSKDGKWGCIDKAGKLAVPMNYGAITEFTQGRAIVRMGSRYGVLKAIVGEFTDVLAGLIMPSRWSGPWRMRSPKAPGAGTSPPTRAAPVGRS